MPASSLAIDTRSVDSRSSTKNMHLVTLGCARNRVDAEVMLGSMLAGGWNHCSSPEEAQLIVVNTCGFIQAAKEESIDTILEMAAYKKHHPVTLVVTGCLSQRYRSQLADGLPEVDLFLGAHQFANLPEILKSWEREREEEKKQENRPLSSPKRFYTQRSNIIYDHLTPRINTLSPHSAYLKVAEGCEHNCAFCIIPAIRGRLRSRKVDSIVDECKNLAAQGIKEVNLIAQDLAAYGRDRGSDDLLPLLKELNNVNDIAWIRLLYMYPENIQEDFLEFFASENKLVKYLDIPMQHGNSDVLKRMNRGVTRQELDHTLAKLHSYIPHITIRTSVMVGFPGESEEEFADLYEFVEKQKFDHLGCFMYSQEAGTVAGAMKEQIPEDIKLARQESIMCLQKRISSSKLHKRVGEEATMLIEKKLSNAQAGSTSPDSASPFQSESSLCYQHTHTIYKGRLASQAPEVDGVAYLHTEPNKLNKPNEINKDLPPGTLLRATITDNTDYDVKLSLS